MLVPIVYHGVPGMPQANVFLLGLKAKQQNDKSTQVVINVFSSI